MLATETAEIRVMETARKAKAAARTLASLSTETRNRALATIAHRLSEARDQILQANAVDLDRARPLVESGQLAEPLFKRLKLDSAKLAGIIAGVERVAALDDPIGRVTLANELDDGLTLYRVNCPIGVIGVIFESRPDALVQISSLCLKSGNAVLLKGGSEAKATNTALFKVIEDAAVESGIPADSFSLLQGREDVKALLGAEGFVDLIIPRGSNELVRYIQQNTTIPVLGHAEGICHIYVDRAADSKKALDVIVDSKVTYPAACNAVETVLIHRAIAAEFLTDLIARLQDNKIEVRVEPQEISRYNLSDVKAAAESDWRTEYLDLILSIKIVEDIDAAIDHINRYGSHHTDAIITENRSAFDRFFAEVDSAGVYLNASTRFADGYRYGFGAEVGISTGKLHPRGPVGLEGLVTYRYKLIGNGSLVTCYQGPRTR